MHWELPVHIVRWQDEADKLRFIRTVVFIQEQQVPVELEWDEFDAVGIHALAFNSEGQPIGTARLLPDGHIGRMAVLKQWRGMGVGRAILQAILHELIQRRASKAILNAQISAVGFYEKFGFRSEGAVFLEANIPHIKMILPLEKHVTI